MPKQGILTELNQKLERVWKENATQIYKLCSRRSNSIEVAKDLFQDVALKFCKSAHSLNLDEPMACWFSVVVKNAYCDQFRRRFRETSFSCLAENGIPYDVIPASASVHFNDEAGQADAEKELYFLMSELNARERASVELTFLEGVSLDEACVSQQVSRRGFTKRRQKAFLKMQKKRRDINNFLEKNDALTLILKKLLTKAG
ncbi:MAG: sigma-70 family RNA polymerase sigma factor [Fibrobacter sp.]|nr:sigma-70 family RNA polymerase sigma factor [Fibrobacter sp.]